MVAVKRAGDDEGAEKLYGDYAKEVAASDLTDEQKQVMMDLMNNDIAHYGKYSE